MTVPTFLRSTLYGAYVNAYNCNMEEAQDSHLKSYRSFAEFFNRPLKERARPISASTMVSLTVLWNFNYIYLSRFLRLMGQFFILAKLSTDELSV